MADVLVDEAAKALGDNCFRLIGDAEPLLNAEEFDGAERRLAEVVKVALTFPHVEKGLGEPVKCARFVSELLGLNEGDRSDMKGEPHVDEALPGGFR